MSEFLDSTRQTRDAESRRDLDAVGSDGISSDTAEPSSDLSSEVIDAPDTDTASNSTCGNGVCEQNESSASCAEDCGPVCGDSSCESGEDAESCPVDCAPICGDNNCTPPETRVNCAVDCSICGDGFCDIPESTVTCPTDCGPVCGNGRCEVGESSETCPTDCQECGDGICDGSEDAQTCAADCLICGDGVCNFAELYECTADCGTYRCGDGVCWRGESWRGCTIDCDSGEPFGPDWERPDVFIIGVSGHAASGPNVDYLYSQGTLNRIALEFNSAGLTVDTLGYADQFYNIDEDSRLYEPPYPALAASEYGFLMLLRDLAEIRDRFIVGQAVPTRLVVVAHSHGAVWAHMALYYLFDLPVDVLVTLDGESLGWRGDGLSFLANDNWRTVISAYTERRGFQWPLGLDASDPIDTFSIPGRPDLQDIEDVVPDNVRTNLETSGDYGFGPIRDGDINVRLDGSFTGIRSIEFDEPHDELDEPYSETMDWVIEQLREIYGL